MTNIMTNVIIFSEDYAHFGVMFQEDLVDYSEIKTEFGYIYFDKRNASVPQLVLPYIRKYNLHGICGKCIVSSNSKIYDEIMIAALIDYIKKNKKLPEKGSLSDYIGEKNG